MISDRPQRGERQARGLSPRDFRRIAEVMRVETGIDLPGSKLPLVQSRLLRRLRALNLKDYRAYCDLIERDAKGPERTRMVSVLTTNVTGFFREKHHFDTLRRDVFPAHADRLRRGGSLRIWSAGCSSGEEAYSVAMTLLEAIPDAGRLDARIVASDIDPAILDRARAGQYSAAAAAGVPDPLRAQYMRPAAEHPGSLVVQDHVRALVEVQCVNLIGRWHFTRPFDVILCRNVVIYFDEAHKAQVWTRLAGALRPDGWLFTGHSERLSGTAAERMELVGTTAYRPHARTSARTHAR